ncbi:ataxin-10 isoform X2 [Ornithorhynchus anatinus]|uniref:Ataxin-10 n=1 Tax=Ornithorhynchus anatinus TaxID=9258 RepID=A0A6I8NKN5_ORNAN|nr:ataxin-10 isoform X2 [Ornithorhynchus anatinus]
MAAPREASRGPAGSPAAPAAPAAPSALAQLQALRHLTALLTQQRHRDTASESVFQEVLQRLTEARREAEVASADWARREHPEPCLQLAAESFRCLRNACVRCPANQGVIRNLNLIGVAVDFICLLLRSRAEGESPSSAVRCGLQFLGNIATGNSDAQDDIWKRGFPEMFARCLSHPDAKVAAYSSMVLFTCLDPARTEDLLQEKHLAVAVPVIEACRNHPEAGWPVTLPDVLLEKLEGGDAASDPDTTATLRSLAGPLADAFRRTCRSVPTLASAPNADRQEAPAAADLLDALCRMSSDNHLLGSVQACPGLLEAAVAVLRLAHLAGKQTGNVSTPSPLLTGDADSPSPAAGFKSRLLRLIGNLCYGNRDNQDQVRRLDGIPLILDHCRVDDHDPLLSQWAIFAIRNLTERNGRNQEFIARMERRGLADPALLRSAGLSVEERDGRLTLRSTARDGDPRTVNGNPRTQLE